MRAQAVAWLVRAGRVFGFIFLMLFLGAGTGVERSPLGLMIGITVGGIAGLWWLELQIRAALARVEARKEGQ